MLKKLFGKRRRKYTASAAAREEARFRRAEQQAHERYLQNRRQIIREMQELQGARGANQFKEMMSAFRQFRELEEELGGRGKEDNWMKEIFATLAMAAAPHLLSGVKPNPPNGSAAATTRKELPQSRVSPPQTNGGGPSANGAADASPDVSSLQSILAGFQILLIDGLLAGEDMETFAAMAYNKIQSHPELAQYVESLATVPVEALITELAKSNPKIQESEMARAKLTELQVFLKDMIRQVEEGPEETLEETI